ncbi:MAG: hypothetical protein HZB26_07135 [Candidatus Hydrogenedentes bacterium]|nr:hypothetical protein [Candidatus Hydrogenedentota bacterium]
MNIWKWLRPSPIIREYPVFGRVRFSRRLSLWEGEQEIHFPPISDSILFSIECGESGPTESHQQVFECLKRNYDGLTASIAGELYRRYSPTPEYEAEHMPYPRSASEMWSMVKLQSLTIGADSVELLYAFRPEMKWDDAMFTVLVEDGKITGSTFGD